MEGPKGLGGPTHLDAELPQNSCSQRSCGPKTGPGVGGFLGGGVLEGAVSCEAEGFYRAPSERHPIVPALCWSLQGVLPWC